MKDNSVVLCITDTHYPYCHIDCHKFLRAIKLRFKPTRVIHLGDELDNSSLSFHEQDVDALAYNQEFTQAKRYMEGMCDIFPEIDFIESNHGSLAYRRAKFGKVPAHWMKSYQDVLGLDPEKYKWHQELMLKLPNGKDCLFVHSLGANALAAAKERHCCLVQGHHHSSMKIDYFGPMTNMQWALQVPCLIKYRAKAFDYSRTIAKMPKIGAALIIHGYPMLIAMPMNKVGRFTQLFGY